MQNLSTSPLTLDRPLAREDIVWCYRALLGREPESEQAIQSHLERGSLRQLVESFLGSPEFKGAHPGPQPHPIALPKPEIDVFLDTATMGKAISRVKATWTHLGEVRPHFSVMTNEGFMPDRLAGTIEQFWQSGVRDSKTLLTILDAHGMLTADKTCVEYGCGVGRVTKSIADAFRRVVAYDISAGHLALAKERMQTTGTRNVELVLCSETFLQPLAKCDAFYSRIVFQHNPPPIMYALVKMALQALNPGGIAVFQLPVYQAGYRFVAAEWLASDPAMDMEMHCLPQARVFEAIAVSGCIPLEVREDGAAGEPFLSNLFVVRKPAARA